MINDQFKFIIAIIIIVNYLTNFVLINDLFFTSQITFFDDFISEQQSS